MTEPMISKLTTAQAAEMIAGDNHSGVVDTLNRKLAEGKGIAVYRNEDLGHPMVGHAVAFTYGSPEAQLETDEVPVRCPDGLMPEHTGGINWRYQLVGIVPKP